MANRICLGFRQPSAEAIRLVDYEILVDGEPVAYTDDGAESTWTYETPVEASLTINVDLPRVLKETGLPDEDPLTDSPASRVGAAIVWKSSKTGRHGATETQEVVDGKQTLKVNLPGTEIGGTVSFRVSVVLLENPHAHEPTLAPKYPGSRLWESTVSVNLESPETQFPLSAINFKEARIEPTSAMWKLEVDRHPHRHASAAIRLQLNTMHKRVEDYLADPKSLDSKDFRAFLNSDVVSQLIMHTLLFDPDELDPEITELGTLADKLVSIHTAIFGEQSLQETKNIYEQNPGEIHARIQSHFFNSQKSKK
ncbi:hypothetical protein [Corynebacterium sp.]|uniref:hypothetical protein n=1 Tax=Corynebacterium sp. TaxID=1720 RepID=UPI0026DAAFCB|nr:hypothetical protein [Corynebacterium sp.]MDO5076535.1 hypothetical protein [Corynebacterium sp.]